MINTNGIRLAKDERLLAFLAERKRRIEIYLQFDGQDAEYVTRLRGAELNEIKQQAIEKLEEYDVNTTLVATLTAPVPQRLYQQVFDTAMAHKNITGISLQPATYSGRYLEPRDLEDRVTFPDCIEALSRCSNGMLQADDFAPLPCAHPNCHQILLAARSGKMIVPLSRYAEISQNLDLLAGGISFTREKSQELVERFLSRASNCGSGCECGSNTLQTFQIGRENQAKDKLSIASLLNDPADETSQILRDFFAKVLRQEASAQDLLRITITSFLDIYNFDIRQLIKCCTHHVLPTGHVVPFCAYNSLYRPGHLQLPDVSTAVIRTQHIN